MVEALEPWGLRPGTGRPPSEVPGQNHPRNHTLTYGLSEGAPKDHGSYKVLSPHLVCEAATGENNMPSPTPGASQPPNTLNPCARAK